MCDWTVVFRDCHILRTHSIGKMFSCFQNSPCYEVVKTVTTNVASDGTAENFMNKTHCLITDKEQIFFYPIAIMNFVVFPIHFVLVSNSVKTLF